MLRTSILLLALCWLTRGPAQMMTDGGPLYGNEWIENGTEYLRIEVAQDGIYRIGAGSLVNGAQYELYHHGRRVPFYRTESGLLFYGRQERGELDAHLFFDAEAQQLNPRYGMYTDTAAYYLRRVAQESEVRFRPGTGTGGPMVEEILRTSERVFSEQQSKFLLRTGGNSIVYSHYDLAEGFGLLSTGNLLSSNGTTESMVELPLPGATGGAAELRLRFGLAFDGHQQEISVDNERLGTVSAEGWTVIEEDYSFAPAGDLATITLRGSGSDRDKANLAYAQVTYPARPEVGESPLEFILPAGPATTLQFTGEAGGSPLLFDLTNSLVFTSGSEVLSFDLPASAVNRRFVLSTEDGLAPATSERLTLDELLPAADADYLIVSSQRLAGPGLEALAAYRGSPEGGGYRVHTVMIEDIYNNFGYGVRRHPQALRNYLDAAVAKAPGLHYLFLVGKGREYRDIRTPEQMKRAQATFFIPGYGLPASDNLLTAPQDGVVPRLATGRLSAITAEEVAIYARKLAGVEAQIRQGGQTIEDREWMKQVLHLGGGTRPSEQFSIRNNLARMETVARSSVLGANINSFYRTSSDPIETSRQEDIFRRINSGVGIITFMGHSSSQNFDFSIDNLDNYRNKDRYMFMMSLGCYSGDSFTEARSISERFIFLPDGGAITFGASKGLGFLSALTLYGESIYEELANELYGQGVGDAVKAVSARYAESTNFTLQLLLEQFFLSGDPAFRFHPRPGPDLVIDPSSVRFSPEVVPAQNDSFTIHLRTVNLGTKTDEVPDSMTLLFRQRLPEGELKELLRYRAAVPTYEDLLSIKLPNLGFAAVGQNRILVSIDEASQVTELPAAAEANNELRSGGEEGVPLTVVANTARVAFPPAYATVGPGVELIANSSDPLAPERRYRLQVATQKDFNAPLIDEELTAPGGVIRYRPSLALIDSTTYYWRISPDSTGSNNQGYLWSESSFTFLDDLAPDETGWAQQHPGQLVDGSFSSIFARDDRPGWEFRKNINDIEIINQTYVSSQLPRLSWNGNRTRSYHRWRVRAGVQVVVVDSINNSIIYGASPGLYNSASRDDLYWSFDTRTETGREGLIQFLDEGIEEGQYVFFWSVQRGEEIEYHNDGWLEDSLRVGSTIYGRLEDEGAQQVRLLAELGSVPYIFAYQKGVGPITEAVATSQDAQARVLIPIEENWSEGTFNPGRIGPATEWSDLRLSFLNRQIGATDSCYFRLFGERSDGMAELLIEEHLDVRQTLDFTYDLSGYGGEYTYLQPSFELYDDTDRTVPSIEEIYVGYRRPGDAAISPAVVYLVPDSLVQGQDLELEIGYENLARSDMDSLLVELRIIDRNNEVRTVARRQAPLPGGASDRFRYTLPSNEFDTDLRMQFTLNPREDQLENIRFNNTLATGLEVKFDRVAPNLQVYYDGRRIREGELISSEPEILIQLRDENRFLRLEDSSAYTIELRSPDGSLESILPNDERVEFIPASGGDENLAELYFRPALQQDGRYTLTVQARDRSGNVSGRSAYRQEFEVINAQLISNVLAYPNPFTTQTRFVYTLTGSTPPETFRIQIMTVSGRVVRDIDLLETEQLSFGTHQTDFAWDGTDEYGDPLANGVYLYRVITSNGEGQQLERYDTGTDQFFQNGLGKVVILR